MAPAERQVLAIPTKVLIEQGLIPNPDKTPFIIEEMKGDTLNKLLEVIERSGEYKNKNGEDGVEGNHNYKQPIMYAFVVSNSEGETKFLFYQREKSGEHSDGRLSGKISAGLGGHMEKTDLSFLDSIYREVNEEAEVLEEDQVLDFKKNHQLDIDEMRKTVSVTIVGIIDDNRDDVGKDHVGVVCMIQTRQGVEIKPRTGEKEEISSYQYLTLTEYGKLITAGRAIPEGWTQLLVDNMLGHINK